MGEIGKKRKRQCKLKTEKKWKRNNRKFGQEKINEKKEKKTNETTGRKEEKHEKRNKQNQILRCKKQKRTWSQGSTKKTEMDSSEETKTDNRLTKKNVKRPDKKILGIDQK